MKHSVLIVEDDHLFRSRFAHALHDVDDLQLAGEADDLGSGMALLHELRPDVLLVDLGLPGGSGIALIREATLNVPHCDVMVATIFGDEQHVLASIEAGATGYLLKDTMADDIATQIRILRAGGSPISPVIARQLLTRFAMPAPGPHDAPPPDEDDSLLSPRERDVLRLCAKGYSFDETARLMEVSRHTVTTFVKRIYRKLQVHSKTEAIFEARKLGLMND